MYFFLSHSVIIQPNKNSLSELEKRERRAMERKLSEMEEELKVCRVNFPVFECLVLSIILILVSLLSFSIFLYSHGEILGV